MNAQQATGWILAFVATSGTAIAALFPSSATPWILGASGVAALALGAMHHQAAAPDPPPPIKEGVSK